MNTKLKSLIAAAGTAALLCLNLNAQTTTNPPPSTTGLGSSVDAVVSFLSKGSNWMVAPYGIYDTGSKSGGAGIGIGYKLSDFVVPVMRLDYIDSHVWMPSGSLQLQVPVTFAQKVTVTPFAFTGIATPVGGTAANNGSVVGIFGLGGAIKLSTHFDLIADYEKWTGFKGNQIRAGFVFKF
jgi:hypothetical protein